MTHVHTHTRTLCSSFVICKPKQYNVIIVHKVSSLRESSLLTGSNKKEEKKMKKRSISERDEYRGVQRETVRKSHCATVSRIDKEWSEKIMKDDSENENDLLIRRRNEPETRSFVVARKLAISEVSSKAFSTPPSPLPLALLPRLGRGMKLENSKLILNVNKKFKRKRRENWCPADRVDP